MDTCEFLPSSTRILGRAAYTFNSSLPLTPNHYSLEVPVHAMKSSLLTTAGKSNSEELSSLADLCCPWLCPSPPWGSSSPGFWDALLSWFSQLSVLRLYSLQPELSPCGKLTKCLWVYIWTMCSIHQIVYPCSQTMLSSLLYLYNPSWSRTN